MTIWKRNQTDADRRECPLWIWDGGDRADSATDLTGLVFIRLGGTSWTAASGSITNTGIDGHWVYVATQSETNVDSNEVEVMIQHATLFGSTLVQIDHSNLPDDPAATSDIAAIFVALDANDDEILADIAALPAAVDTLLSAEHGAGSWEGSSAPTADAIADEIMSRIVLHTGLVQSATSTTAVLDATASEEAGSYVNGIFTIVAGTGVDQIRQIVAYDAATQTVTLDRAFDVALDATSEYEITRGPSPYAAALQVWEGLIIEGTKTGADFLREIWSGELGKALGFDAIRAAGGSGTATYYGVDGTTIRFTITYSTNGRTANAFP